MKKFGCLGHEIIIVIYYLLVDSLRDSIIAYCLASVIDYLGYKDWKRKLKC